MLSAKASAPGKLILSGEHSVVYGAPAVAIAVDHRVNINFFRSDPRQTNSLRLRTDFFPSVVRNLSDLDDIGKQIDQGYENFLQGQMPISELLTETSDLLFYVLSCSKFPHPGQITLTSDIPTGAGMGSSAAVIAGLLRLCDGMNGVHRTASEFIARVRHCERLQHGRGSMLDAAAVTCGGMIRLQEDRVTNLETELGSGWYQANTGSPAVSTGQTVAYVRQRHAESNIWQDFTAVTEAFLNALQAGNPAELLRCIRTNHQLLQTIGVVPDAVQQLIQLIEAAGGAAKISGAGSHLGDSGGQLLVFLPENNPDEVGEQTGLHLEPIKQSARGAEFESED